MISTLKLIDTCRVPRAIQKEHCGVLRSMGRKEQQKFFDALEMARRVTGEPVRTYLVSDKTIMTDGQFVPACLRTEYNTYTDYNTYYEGVQYKYSLLGASLLKEPLEMSRRQRKIYERYYPECRKQGLSVENIALCILHEVGHERIYNAREVIAEAGFSYNGVQKNEIHRFTREEVQQVIKGFTSLDPKEFLLAFNEKQKILYHILKAKDIQPLEDFLKSRQNQNDFSMKIISGQLLNEILNESHNQWQFNNSIPVASRETQYQPRLVNYPSICEPFMALIEKLGKVDKQIERDIYSTIKTCLERGDSIYLKELLGDLKPFVINEPLETINELEKYIEKFDITETFIG